MTRLFGALAAFVLIVACLANAGLADEVADSTPMAYLVIYRPGPAWVPGKPVREQPPKEHGSYLLDLYEQGILKHAGPFADDTGAAVVLQVTDAAKARALADADPAVRAGVFVHEIHPWRLVPWDQHLEKRRARKQQSG